MTAATQKLPQRTGRLVLALVAAGSLVVCGVKGPPRPPASPATEALDGDAGPACCAVDGGAP